MKIIFNDATEITVQQVESHGDYLRVLTVGNTPEQLKVLFTDSSHTSQADWAPGVAPSLWVAVSSGEHAGTQEDPIPVPDTVTTAGMEYEKGKYYSEGDTVYLMDRTGMNTGETVKLYFAPSALLGQYFSAVE